MAVCFTQFTPAGSPDGFIPGGCIEEITDSTLVGAGTAHPVGFTIHHLCELYWKWKEATIDSSMADDYHSASGSATVERKDENGVSYTMPQLACKKSWDEEDGIEYYDYVNPPMPAVGDVFTAFGAFRIGSYYYNGLYYPSMNVNAFSWVKQGDDLEGFVYENIFLFTDLNYHPFGPGTPPSVTYPFTGSITMQDGTSYDLPFYGVGQFIQTINSASIEISCAQTY